MLSLFSLMSVLFSCSSDDESGTNSQIQINPPTWIQGTWMVEESSVESGYKFTSNDFILILLNVQSSQREQLEFSLDSGLDASASDNSTENFYSITLNFPPGQSISYTFDRISNTEIQTTTSGVTASYIKQ